MLSHGSKLGITKKVIKVTKISEIFDTLTVGEKLIALIGNKTKRILEVTQRKIDLNMIRFKESNMQIKKGAEKERDLL